MYDTAVLTNLQYYAKQNPDQFLGAISKLIEIEAQRGHTFERETVKSLEQGCMTTLVAMLDPSIEPESGAFLEDGNVSLVQLPDYAKGVNNEEALWSLSENLVGQRFEL